MIETLIVAAISFALGALASYLYCKRKNKARLKDEGDSGGAPGEER